MRKQGIDGTGMLNLYDRVTGIFNEIFDSRLLTAAIFALIGYCCCSRSGNSRCAG